MFWNRGGPGGLVWEVRDFEDFQTHFSLWRSLLRLYCTVTVVHCMRAHPHRVFAVLGRYSESRVIRGHGTWRGMSWTTFPRSAERQRAHREAQGCIFEKCLLSALRSSEKQSFCIFESQNDICIHRAWRLSGLPFHQMDRSTGF